MTYWELRLQGLVLITQQIKIDNQIENPSNDLFWIWRPIQSQHTFLTFVWGKQLGRTFLGSKTVWTGEVGATCTLSLWLRQFRWTYRFWLPNSHRYTPKHLKLPTNVQRGIQWPILFHFFYLFQQLHILDFFPSCKCSRYWQVNGLVKSCNNIQMYFAWNTSDAFFLWFVW